MLPQKMATWRTEWPKLQESEKWDVQGEHSQERCLPRRGALPVSGGKDYPSHQRQKDTERNLNGQALLRVRQIIILSSDSLPYHISHDSLVFIKPRIKTFTINCFFGSSCPYERRLTCHVKLTLNNFVCFSPVNLLFPFNFQIQPGLKRSRSTRVKENFSPYISI